MTRPDVITGYQFRCPACGATVDVKVLRMVICHSCRQTMTLSSFLNAEGKASAIGPQKKPASLRQAIRSVRSIFDS